VTSGVVRVGEIDIAYDARGEGVPMLLIAGFGMTRDMWDSAFCDGLASRGYTVVRMDNRDTGLSTRLSALGFPDIPRLFVRSVLGRTVTPPYTLEDMARDAVGLMKSLGHARFHVVGASMGGMIAQTIALEHPASVASLTSIMSTPGGRRYSFASPGALRASAATASRTTSRVDARWPSLWSRASPPPREARGSSRRSSTARDDDARVSRASRRAPS
jgi:pimeloyl-ACP methyl ester carboxylesterase